ncbi:hypothetical protein [Methylobacterium fujisawaense]
MRPENTPGRADLPTTRVRARAYFDLVQDGVDVRIRSLVDLDVPSDAGRDLQPIARCNLVHGGRLVEATYLGLDGGAFLPATIEPLRFAGGMLLLGRSVAQPDEDILDLAALTSMHPDMEVLAKPARHRVSGLVRDRWRTEFRDEQAISDAGLKIDLDAVRPRVDDVREAASRMLLVREGKLHVRAPLPFWTLPYRDANPRPQLVLPQDGDVNRGVTAFAHDRIDDAMAFADLPSVRGRRRPGAPEGSIEAEPGWHSEDDLSWVARTFGSSWVRDLDPIVPELSAEGVGAWHSAANAPGILREGGRAEARNILAGVHALRDEIAATPAFDAQRFWIDKTRTLADRLIHIEGMAPEPRAAPYRTLR